MPNKSIPVFILAGGLGTRISEETILRPKPMVEIGDIPVLIHLMRWYYSFGFSDFIICGGYKVWEIKQYFLNYEFRINDLQIDHRSELHAPPKVFERNHAQEKWRIRVLDTGAESMTGSRVAQALDLISKYDDFEDFALTYGDGLSDIDLQKELDFHLSHGKCGTLLGVRPMARFGELEADSHNLVKNFHEKPQLKQGLVNGGFFFFKRRFRKYLDIDPSLVLESQSLTQLAREGELMVYPHTGFWHPMDTLRDKNYLQSLWETGKAPWKKNL